MVPLPFARARAPNPSIPPVVAIIIIIIIINGLQQLVARLVVGVGRLDPIRFFIDAIYQLASVCTYMLTYLQVGTS